MKVHVTGEGVVVDAWTALICSPFCCEGNMFPLKRSSVSSMEFLQTRLCYLLSHMICEIPKKVMKAKVTEVKATAAWFPPSKFTW